jgi:hypothetical protein
MHKVDLLNGQGIPPRTTFVTIAIIVLMVAVPFAAAAAMTDRYLQNRETIVIRKQETARYQATVDDLVEAVASKESIEKRGYIIHGKLLEVSSCVGDYVQWSPILETLAKNMPPKMVMSKLSAKSRLEKRRVPKRYEPGKTIDVPFSKRTLVLEISGDLPGNYETLVRDFRNQLKSDPGLGPKLKDITASKKPFGTGDDKTVSWTMNLIFESES